MVGSRVHIFGWGTRAGDIIEVSYDGDEIAGSVDDWIEAIKFGADTVSVSENTTTYCCPHIGYLTVRRISVDA